MISNKEYFLRLGWIPTLESMPSLESTHRCKYEDFKRIIVDEIQKIPSKKVAIMLSGGIDSATIAWLCKEAGKDVIAYTVAYTDDHGEEPEAVKTAKLLSLKHIIHKVSEKDCLDIFEEYVNSSKKIHAEWSGLPIALLMKKIKEDGIDDVLLGDGGDDLFGGYSYFKMMYDLEQLLPNRLKELRNRTWILYGISRDIMKDREYLGITNDTPNREFNEFMIRYIESYFRTEDLTQCLIHYDIDNWLNQAMVPKIEAGCKMYKVNAYSPMLSKEMLKLANGLKPEERVNKYFMRRGMVGTPLEPKSNLPKLGTKPPFIEWLNRPTWNNYLTSNLRNFNVQYITDNLLRDFTGCLFAFRCLVWNNFKNKEQ